MSYAAAAGADYAIANADSSFNATKIAAAATGATGPSGGISISPTPTEFYGCATVTGVTASTQGATCPAGTSTGGTAGKYVSVTATMPFSAMFSAAGISYPSSLSSTAVVRIQ